MTAAAATPTPAGESRDGTPGRDSERSPAESFDFG